MIPRRLRRRAATPPASTQPHEDPAEGPELPLEPDRWPEPPSLEELAPAGRTTYIGRAPVFDRRLAVAGYRLMVDEIGGAEPPGKAERSRQVLTRALLEVGLDSLIGAKLGFVEIPVELLAEGMHRALPAQRIVIEASGEVGAEELEVLSSTRMEGYEVILASPWTAQDPRGALAAAGAVRLEMGSGDLMDQASRLRRWSPRARILVDGLTSSEQIEPCRQAGATWLRGDLLRPAERIDEPTVPLHRIAVLELLAELERPDVGIDDVDRLISTDLGMSYKLLRMANSSYLALERRVERTRDAIVYLGLDSVRAVAALLALAEASDHAPEIVQLSLVRARHCEELVRRSSPATAHAAFTTGMLSTLDVVLGLSVEQVLDRIPVADQIAAALRSRHGVLGRALEVVIAYEQGDLGRLASLDADPAATVLAYRQALLWMADLNRGLEGAPRPRHGG